MYRFMMLGKQSLYDEAHFSHLILHSSVPCFFLTLYFWIHVLRIWDLGLMYNWPKRVEGVKNVSKSMYAITSGNELHRYIYRVMFRRTGFDLKFLSYVVVSHLRKEICPATHGACSVPSRSSTRTECIDSNITLRLARLWK